MFSDTQSLGGGIRIDDIPEIAIKLFEVQIVFIFQHTPHGIDGILGEER
jgi:hypothetical protein